MKIKMVLQAFGFVAFICFAAIFIYIDRDVETRNVPAVMMGMLYLKGGGLEIFQVDHGPDCYLVSGNDYDPFIEMMTERGWAFVEQIGSGLIFKNGGQEITVRSRVVASKFTLIESGFYNN
ncbi:hypothetical protein [Bacillus marinisedimentorum]|uniref:hypothetical protein n=1 Tax=Bacillus marinisedimentorum TaxID=1821260 RepID=UPI0008729A25|nr:hypothetical protein [Bacillus marinisedimentorum]